MSLPSVSICLTTYNRADVLPATIESILAQSFKDFELIISDDNSSDNTRNVCEAYALKDDRVKYFRNPQNLKMPGNLNHAISKATGMYVANLHDGDVYRTDLIHKWKEALDQFPEALFVFNGYVIENTQGGSFSYIHPGFKPLNEGKVLMDYFLTHFTSAPWGTVMARKEAYTKFGFFNGEFGFISDVEMWLRLGSKGKVAYVPEAMITLVPREKNHPYYYPHWNVVRNNFRILRLYYRIYKMETTDTGKVNSRIIQEIIKQVLVLFKHKQWDRMQQGIEILRKCPYFWVRMFAKFPLLKGKVSDGFTAEQFWNEVLL